MKKLVMPLFIIVIAILYAKGCLIVTGELPIWCKYILSGWQYFMEGIIR